MALLDAKSGRETALDVMFLFEKERRYAGSLLETRLPALASPAERRRATDLVLGTVRNRLAIDAVIEAVTGRPVRRIDRLSLAAARVGAYEILYCPDAKIHAIVNETVEAVKKGRGGKTAGFVNAALRGIGASVKNRRACPAATDPVKTLPNGPSSGCELAIRILPDPVSRPVEYLSRAFSLPEWLVDSWRRQYGPEDTESICRASARRPGICLRVNLLKTTVSRLLELFRAQGVAARALEGPMVGLEGPASLRDLPGYTEGFFSVQDPASSRAAALLNPRPGWKVLDLCAAPGGKTTQIAELTGDRAAIVATDKDPARLKLVASASARLGIGSITTVAYAELAEAHRRIGPFDGVLVDAPCSNTGVLARRPEARYRLSPATVRKCAETQSELLCKAAAMLRPSGVLCYSTCSIQREENDLLVAGFVAAAGFRLETEELILPCELSDHDGGYCALMVS